MADDAKLEEQAGGAEQTLDFSEYTGQLEEAFRLDDAEKASFQKMLGTLARLAMDESGKSAVSSNAKKAVKELIAGIDTLLTAQMNEVLHAPEITRLEGAWRGLNYLVKNTSTSEKLKIRVMSIKKEELGETLADFEGENEYMTSPIFRKLYTEEYSQFGGEPYGCILGDYEFDHNATDVQLLRNMAKVSASAHAPFFAAAGPKLFRMNTWEELPNPQDLEKIVSNAAYATWNGFREKDEAKYIGLTMPRVLSRLPYSEEDGRVKGFRFNEEIEGQHENYVWMNAAYALGVNINRSQNENGFATQIRGVEGGGTVIDLPVHAFSTDDGGIGMKCPTEVAIDDEREGELSALGMIPLLHRKHTDNAAFLGIMSLQNAEKLAGQYADMEAASNIRLSANIAYLMPVTRFAHYLKAIARDKVGTFKERSDMQEFLQKWISLYVAPPLATDAEKARAPLAEAEVEVSSVEGRPGYYDAKFSLRPLFFLEGLKSKLSLVSTLPSKRG
ncbi:MAG: type VI secretion system contractile sheath large subunit [Paracoccaceae bacterium]|nr:type VI secretion system contractile sheath large subunit [Paracoccaceae bacterium]